MSIWNLFKRFKNSLFTNKEKEKNNNIGLTLRMGDKIYYPEMVQKVKIFKDRDIVISQGNRKFQIVGESYRFVEKLGKVEKNRSFLVKCLETNKVYTVEKDIFDILFNLL